MNFSLWSASALPNGVLPLQNDFLWGCCWTVHTSCSLPASWAADEPVDMIKLRLDSRQKHESGRKSTQEFSLWPIFAYLPGISLCSLSCSIDWSPALWKKRFSAGPLWPRGPLKKWKIHIDPECANCVLWSRHVISNFPLDICLILLFSLAQARPHCEQNKVWNCDQNAGMSPAPPPAPSTSSSPTLAM